MNSGAIRIIDANANRAREALRTLEDLARFELASAPLSAELKAARHELRCALDLAGLSALSLLAHRDTPGDVGTSHTTPAERTRSSTRDAAIAAGKRAGEALRVLEESVKVASNEATTDQTSAASGRFKALRYRVYELERRLVMAFGTGRQRQWRLCVLITESLCTHMPWADVARAAIDGGADCLQLREKSLDSGELLERAQTLARLCRNRGVACIINDRADIALLAGADGVHVGQTDLGVADIRRLAGDRLLIGVSTSNLDQARAAAEAGADSCGVGPMFPTTTKHKPALSGPEYLREYLGDPSTARLPHLAIGGISAANIGELARAGSQGVAVSSAVCGSKDPANACREILSALLSAQNS